METRPGSPAVPRELENRYKDISSLGAGAMGAVFKAHDSNLDKTVAIKVMSADQMMPEKVVRFQQEAKLASKLKHRNLVTIMDFGVSSRGEPYLVMEHVAGESLQSILDRLHSLPVLSALNIAIQICEGMEHAHNSGVIHRDLKPSNVIVTGDNFELASAKVLDFGIAKLDEDADHRLTHTGSFVGTPHFMSPEQFDTQKNVDRRSDVYSVGSILFYMLTGAHVFDGETIFDIINQQRDRPAPRVSSLVLDGTISGAIDTIVTKCLERDPNARYQTMSELKNDLMPVLENLHAQVQTVKVPRQVENVAVDIQFNPAQVKGLEAAQSRRKVLMVASSIVLLVGGLVTALALMQRPDLHEVKGKPTRPEEKKKQTALINTMFTRNEEGEWITQGALTDEDIKLFVESKPAVLKLVMSNMNIDEVTDDGFLELSKLPVESLELVNAGIRDSAFREITAMPSLRTLRASSEPVTSAGLNFHENSLIKELRLDYTKVSDDSASEFAKLKHLQALYISNTEIGDETLRHLANLPLRLLYIEHTKITDKGLEYLGKNRTLQTLWLGGTSITAAGLKNIRNLPLRAMSFDESKIFDDEMLERTIEYWPNLDDLAVSASKVSPKGIQLLTKLKKLEQIDACELNLHDPDIKPFYTMKQLKFISLIGNDLSNEAVLKFLDLPKLDSIILNRNLRLTNDTIQKLKTKIKKKVEAIDIETPENPAVQDFAQMKDPNLDPLK